jgi:hypothetical protein
MDLPQKVFYGGFALPLLRNSQKRHKNIKNKRHLPPSFSGVRRFQLFFLTRSAPLASRTSRREKEVLGGFFLKAKSMRFFFPWRPYTSFECERFCSMRGL